MFTSESGLSTLWKRIFCSVFSRSPMARRMASRTSLAFSFGVVTSQVLPSVPTHRRCRRQRLLILMRLGVDPAAHFFLRRRLLQLERDGRSRGKLDVEHLAGVGILNKQRSRR